MRYWKGLAVAVAIDLVWIMGCPLTVTEPDVPAFAFVEADSRSIGDLEVVGQLEDSLMMSLQEHPADIAVMEQLADAYAEQGWHEAAIGPLARAVQLDPSRRRLWVALDRAVEMSGRAKMTDAELTRRAADFVDAVKTWGMGC